jgi:hypothetical protein
LQKNPEYANATNNICKITERFTKHQTQRHTPSIHGRKGLAYTPLDKATATAEVYEDKFQTEGEANELDNFH